MRSGPGKEWVYYDSRFSTFTTDVAFVSFPASGELHGFSFPIPNVVNVGWKVIPDATGYMLWVGTSPGKNDLGSTYIAPGFTFGGGIQGNVAYAQVSLYNSSQSVSFNQMQTYYLRLWTQKGSQW